jgi:hypothetical protein
MMLTGWMFLVLTGTSLAQSSAREDYLNDCASSAMTPRAKQLTPRSGMLRGDRSADLT